MTDKRDEHASLELIKAMRNDWPIVEEDESTSGCGKEYYLAYGWGSYNVATGRSTREWDSTAECTRPVTCTRCLRLMFDAIEPVRRDVLLMRGLIEDPIE